MSNEIVLAVLAGLGGMLGWGFADFFAKKTIDIIGDISSLVWGHIFGTLALVGIVLYQVVVNNQQVAFPTEPLSWLGLAIFGVGQAIIYLFLYKGFGKGQVSVLSPVFATFPGITALISILFYKEVISGFVAIGLLVILSGVILINTDLSALRMKKFAFTAVAGFKEIALATVMAGFWTLFWARFVGGEDWLVYVTFMYAFMTIAIIVIALVMKINIKFSNPSLWKFLILIGLGEALAYSAVSLGYSLTTHTSIVAVLSGAFSLPVIVLAKLFLKEQITKLQTIGSIIVIIGIMIIASL